jgi:arginine exporter protein ArgO
MDYIRNILNNNNTQSLVISLLAGIGLMNLIQINKVIRNQEALLKINLAILNDMRLSLAFQKM